MRQRRRNSNCKKLSQRDRNRASELAKQAMDLINAGRFSEAETSLKTSLELNFDRENVLLFARLLLQMKKPAEAAKFYEQLLREDERQHELWFNLGFCYLNQNRFDAALSAFTSATRQKRDFAPAHNMMGVTYGMKMMPYEAVKHIKKALSIDPNQPSFHNNLGNAYRLVGNYEEAAKAHLAALNLNPSYADAAINAAISLEKSGQLSEAIAIYKRAIELAPNHVPSFQGYGNTLFRQGYIKEAVRQYQQGADVDPNDPGIAQSAISIPHYLSDFSQGEAKRLAIQWAESFTPSNLLNPPKKSRSNKIRVGYMSGDFHSHPVGLFIEPVLRQSNKDEFEIVCFANQRYEDDVTKRCRSYADRWLSIWHLSDSDLDRLIRDNDIDILIELSGHTNGNRLTALAAKPAPVVLSYIGYYGTTGVPAIDGIIADDILIPHDEEPFYTEKVLRMPGCYLCYYNPQIAPTPKAPPVLENHFITFGCFNNAAKIGSAVLELWAKILTALPDSRLLLKYNAYADEGTRTRVSQILECHGVLKSQICFEEGSSLEEYFASYGRVDISLDPFPFNGGTTTFDSLYMGVPVLTLKGDRFAGHLGETILSHAGLAEWIASSGLEYVEKAIEFASDQAALAKLRRELRTIATATLGDEKSFARAFENLLKDQGRALV